jgi:hypothetical protein
MPGLMTWSDEKIKEKLGTRRHLDRQRESRPRRLCHAHDLHPQVDANYHRVRREYR